MALEEIVGIRIALYVDIPQESPNPPVRTLVGALRNVQLTEGQADIDVSHAGNYGWERREPGQNNWSASADTVILQDISGKGFDPALAELKRAKRAREKVTVEIRYPNGKSESGQAIVSQLQVSAPYDGAATGSIQLTGAGALTEADSPA